jgi:glutathione S-transferase
MRAAHAAMNRHVEALEDQLASRQGRWVLGERYTLADVMWTVSLYRMKWLGLGDAWERGRCPRVGAYLERAFARPSFRSAVIDWPFAYAPSPHVAEFSGLAVVARFFLEIIKRGG